jgi:hypothetical protein
MRCLWKMAAWPKVISAAEAFMSRLFRARCSFKAAERRRLSDGKMRYFWRLSNFLAGQEEPGIVPPLFVVDDILKSRFFPTSSRKIQLAC